MIWAQQRNIQIKFIFKTYNICKIWGEGFHKLI